MDEADGSIDSGGSEGLAFLQIGFFEESVLCLFLCTVVVPATGTRTGSGVASSNTNMLCPE